MVSGFEGYKLENGVVALKHKQKLELGLSLLLALDLHLMNFRVAGSFG